VDPEGLNCTVDQVQIVLAGLHALETSHFEPSIFLNAVGDSAEVLTTVFPDDSRKNG
jgi:hypothetical protein